MRSIWRGGRRLLPAIAVALVGALTSGVAGSWASGSPPVLSANPSSTVGNPIVLTPKGTAGSSATVTFTNTQGRATGALMVSLSKGSPLALFAITSDHCSGMALGPGKTCTLTVAYNGSLPTTTQTATLTVKGTAVPALTSYFSIVGDVPPVANNDTYSTAADQVLAVSAPGVLTNDTSAKPLTASLVSGPSNGTLAFNSDGSFTYTPSGAFAGQDSFTYTARDGILMSAPATVTIDVVAAITVTNTSLTRTVSGVPGSQATGNVITDSGVVATPGPAGVYQVGFQTLGFGLTGSVSSTNTDFIATVSLPSGQLGVLDVNKTTGAYTFTSGPAGAPLTSQEVVGFFVTDNSVWGAIAPPISLTFTITPPPPPTANNYGYNMSTGQTLMVTAVAGVLSNDIDPSGLPLTPALVSGPSDGTLAFNADGSFTYTPSSTFYGTDSFTFTISNANGTSAPGTVNVFVKPVFTIQNSFVSGDAVGNGVAEVSGNILTAAGVTADPGTPELLGGGVAFEGASPGITASQPTFSNGHTIVDVYNASSVELGELDVNDSTGDYTFTAGPAAATVSTAEEVEFEIGVDDGLLPGDSGNVFLTIGFAVSS